MLHLHHENERYKSIPEIYNNLIDNLDLLYQNTEFLAEAIYEAQPFKEGTFAFTNAIRDGVKALEGEVIRVANRMRK